jgi:REP element-mobilizing transposase RayT
LEAEELTELSLDRCWELFGSIFNTRLNGQPFRIISFVLMNNHFHLLIGFKSDNDVTEFMADLSRALKPMIRMKSGLGYIHDILRYQKWGLKNPVYFSRAYRYVYRNPINAGLCKFVEEYDFSTLRFLFRRNDAPFPLFDAPTLYSRDIPWNIEARIRWLNSTESLCKNILTSFRHLKDTGNAP